MFGPKIPRSNKLADESADIHDIFTETQRKLKDVNERIDSENNSLEQQIAQLQMQKNLLATTKERNSTVISRIDKIFE